MLRSETLYDSFLRLRRLGSTFLLSERNSRKDEGMKYKIVIDSFSFLIKCLIFSLHSNKKQRRLTNSPTYILLVYTNIFFFYQSSLLHRQNVLTSRMEQYNKPIGGKKESSYYTQCANFERAHCLIEIFGNRVFSFFLKLYQNMAILMHF